MKTWLLLAAIALLVVWLFYRRRGRIEQERPEPVKALGARASKFHAVSIQFDPDACAAAKEMAGRRFLATAAPQLPLPGCTASKCNCRFKHHDDRRSGRDRRNPFAPGGSVIATGKFHAEKRSGKDRRKDPDDEFFVDQ